MITCPSSERLDQWASELLPRAEQEAITPHVENCLRCQAALDQLMAAEAPATDPARFHSDRPTVPFLDHLKRFTPLPKPTPLPTVSGYEILGPLGQGGMGIVYKARQLGLDRFVALKMVSAAGRLSADVRARFFAEARAVARLRHPDIVRVHEVGEADGVTFFSMEFVEGGSLADELDGKPRPPQSAAALLRTVARAVDYAHRQGVVHRDLKPANILLAADGTPKLTDFGIAKHLDAPEGLTRTGEIVGTPSYMAPEQASGETSRVGPTTDVYALGVILYELLTGRPPHRASDTLETLLLVRSQEPVPPRRLVPGIPRDLEAICLKCLEKDPASRYATAAELADDLDRHLRGEPVVARAATPLDRLFDALGRSEHDRQLRPWGTAVLLLGPAMGLPTMGITGLAVWAPHQVKYLFAVGIVVVLASLATAFWLRRYRQPSGTGSAVRQFVAILVGHVLAVGSVLVVSPLLFDSGNPLDPLKAGPFVAIVTGQMYYSLGAAFWGRFYLAGVACLVLALLMPLAPMWGPFCFGALLLIIFTAWGLHLRHLGRE
jgi:eukaryotic-like serine/threonine-protein kinase